ncbi:hypothetical protein [Streptomyces lydicus]|uniref:hypothetical protein n=1 Tax=Streptomyces lydicus TaxID=47763 RepID=UPI0037B73325
MRIRRVAVAVVTAAIPIVGLTSPAVAATPNMLTECDVSRVSVTVDDWATEYNRNHVMYLAINNQSSCDTKSWVIEWDRPASITDTMARNMNLTRNGQHYKLTGKLDTVASAHSKETLPAIFGNYTGFYSQPKNLRVTPQF